MFLKKLEYKKVFITETLITEIHGNVSDRFHQVHVRHIYYPSFSIEILNVRVNYLFLIFVELNDFLLIMLALKVDL